MSKTYEKDWKSFVKNIEEVEDPLPDSPYQKELFKTHPKKKKELIIKRVAYVLLILSRIHYARSDDINVTCRRLIMFSFDFMYPSLSIERRVEL